MPNCEHLTEDKRCELYQFLGVIHSPEVCVMCFERDGYEEPVNEVCVYRETYTYKNRSCGCDSIGIKCHHPSKRSLADIGAKVKGRECSRKTCKNFLTID